MRNIVQLLQISKAAQEESIHSRGSFRPPPPRSCLRPGTKEAPKTHVSRKVVAQSGSKPWCERRCACNDTEGPRRQPGRENRIPAAGSLPDKLSRGGVTSRETWQDEGGAGVCWEL